MRTPENDPEFEQRLEAINQDENPIERAWKLDRFYEEVDALNDLAQESQPSDEHGTLEPPGT